MYQLKITGGRYEMSGNVHQCRKVKYLKAGIFPNYFPDEGLWSSLLLKQILSKCIGLELMWGVLKTTVGWYKSKTPLCQSLKVFCGFIISSFPSDHLFDNQLTKCTWFDSSKPRPSRTPRHFTTKSGGISRGSSVTDIECCRKDPQITF